MTINLSKNTITVLMLDHEPLLIDRRIVLEAQTLVQQGYRVVLATRGDGVKPDTEIERGMEVRRFVCADIGGRGMDRQQISQWICSPGNDEVEKYLSQKFNFLPRKAQLFIYMLMWPPVMALRLRRFASLKHLMGRAFEPAVFSLMLRPAFLMPYFRLLFFKLLGNESQADTWEESVEKFALDLRPDVVHAHDLPNLSRAKRIADAVGARLVYDAHELYPMQYFSSESRRTELMELESGLIEYTDAVITVNRQCADVLESTYSIKNVIPLSNATESPEGFDPSLRTKLWHERFDLADDVKIMVFQGGINPVRNIDQLIQSMTQLPDWIHVGFITYAKDVPYYVELTRKLGVFHRIHYVIEIPWHEVNQWLAASDVGIMPYQVTNFNAQISSPNKLFEFVVAGLPIIGSSALVNVQKAIEEDGIGLSTLLGDPDSYSRVIHEMFINPEGPERFRKNVLAVRHKYMWSNEEPKLVDLYRRICDPHFVVKSVVVKS